MKQAEIQIGQTYQTKVNGAWVPVVVVERVATNYARGSHTRYVVRRVDSEKPLSKWRTAAALQAL